MKLADELALYRLDRLPASLDFRLHYVKLPGNMGSFEGFLDRCTLIDGELHVRLIAGGFDPSPTEAPVRQVIVRESESAQSSYEALRRVRETDSGVYFALQSDDHALVQSDHGEEVHHFGRSIAVQPEQFQAQDFERLAKSNHEWGSGLDHVLREALVRSSNTRSLVQQQAARIEAKLEGHEPGSTARTLYEQHLAFLGRLLQELGV